MLMPAIKGRRQQSKSEPAENSTTCAAVTTASEVEVGSVSDSTPPIRWIADPDGSTSYFDGPVRASPGYSTSGDWDGGRHIHPDDVDRVSSAWAHAIGTQTPFHLDYRIGRADGEYRWHAFRANPVFDDQNIVFRWVGTATDIDDAEWSKPIRLAFRKSEETRTLLEMLLSKAPIGFGFVDRDFRVVIMNEVLAAVNGSSVAEQVGRTVAEIHPLGWPQVEARYRHILETGEAMLDFEVTTSTSADPSLTRHLMTSYYPVIVGDENRGIGIVVLDITARKRDEEAMRFQTELLAAAGQAMVAVDLDGVITYWNTAAEELYGRLAEEVVGRNGVDLVPGGGTTDQGKVMADAMVRRQRSTGDCLVTRRDGSTIAVRVTATPVFDRDRNLTGVIACSVDVTDRQADPVRGAEEARFEFGFERSAIGALIADLDGTTRRVNTAMCAILGRPAELLIDRKWTDYEHPDELPLWDAVTSGVARGEDTYSDERRYVRPDGSVVWTLSNVALARDEGRAAQYYFVQLQDITEAYEARTPAGRRSPSTQPRRTSALTPWTFDDLTRRLTVHPLRREDPEP
jgi:PAS domain S-box-containing protein